MFKGFAILSTKTYAYMLGGATLIGAGAGMIVRAGQQSTLDILEYIAKNPPLK